MIRTVVSPIKRSTEAIKLPYDLSHATASTTGRDPGVRSRGAHREFHGRRGRAGDDPGGGFLSGEESGGAARLAAVRAREGKGAAGPARGPLAAGPVGRVRCDRGRVREPPA